MESMCPAMSNLVPLNVDPILVGLVGCFGFNGPLRQYFSLSRAISQRGRKRRERIE